MAVRQKDLRDILALHQQRYPLMEPTDYGKLIYQNEFGPEHMIESPEAVEERIVREWTAREDGPLFKKYFYRRHRQPPLPLSSDRRL